MHAAGECIIYTNGYRLDILTKFGSGMQEKTQTLHHEQLWYKVFISYHPGGTDSADAGSEARRPNSRHPLENESGYLSLSVKCINAGACCIPAF